MSLGARTLIASTALAIGLIGLFGDPDRPGTLIILVLLVGGALLAWATTSWRE